MDPPPPYTAIVKDEDVVMQGSIAPQAQMLQQSGPASIFPSSTNATEVAAADLPKTAPEFVKAFMTDLRPKLLLLITRCTLVNGSFRPGKAPLTQEETDYVISVCKALAIAPQLPSDQLAQLNLKNTLLMVMGRLPAKPTRFPISAGQAATVAFDRFEAEEWGVQAQSRSTSPPISPGYVRSGRGRGRMDSVTSASTSTTSHRRRSSAMVEPQVPGTSKLAPTAHPIYGDNGIMRGINRKWGGKRYSYELRHDLKRSHKAFGHNGIAIGQWWPLQICALRDGAHGSIGGGMSHTKEDGVRSIVINSQYEETDRDEGDTIWYSMPGSVTNEDPVNLPGEAATEAMRLSWHNDKDIRVIRGSGAGWAGRPSVGLRYDGLYKITDERMGKNSKGGLFVQFKLERNVTGQPALSTVTSRPTGQEKLDEALVKNGYN